MPNTAAKRVIETYLSREEPSYALLVDSPWGSGKTTILKKVTNFDVDPTRLYVSLYDVHSLEAFDWALVRAINPWSDEANASWGRRAKELASNIQVFGCSVDLTKVNLTEIALRSLPDTIIFDDVERCGLSHAQLSGLINRFVEHQKKRVILVANSDAHKDKETFDASREKVIGQTISLRPEVEAMLAASWVKIAAGQGRDALRDRQALIIKTFQEAGHQNLRLLLHSIRDAAAMLDAIEPEMLKHDRSIEHLVATFLALHMAYHGGLLSKDDMRQRGRFNRRALLKARNKEEPPDALESLQLKHPNCNIEAGYNDVLPVDLGYLLVVDGYANRSYIRSALRETRRFSNLSEQPDWVKLWKWYEQPLTDLESASQRIEEKRKSIDITEPGEILQIYGAERLIAKYRDNTNVKAVARKWYNYIEDLSRAKKIPSFTPSRDSEKKYGFEWGHGTIGYRGLAFETDRRANVLLRRLQNEMDLAFEREIPALVTKLMDSLRERPYDFNGFFSYSGAGENFSHTPILHHLPHGDFATILLGLFDADRQTAALIANTLSQRRSIHNTELAAELPWFDELEKELVRQAKAKSDLYLAQVRLFISKELKSS